MLMAHDAATTYAKDGTCHRFHQLNNYAVTHRPAGTLATLLDCGARAIDLRPFMQGDTLVLHHGDVTFHTPMAQALDDLVDWANANPGELVLVMSSHCAGGSGCSDATKQAFYDRGIHSLRERDVRGTLEHALERGRLPGNGSVLWTTTKHVQDNFEQDLGCYHLLGRRLAGARGSNVSEDNRRLEGLSISFTGLSCYGSDNDRATALEAMWRYFDATVNPRSPPDDKLWNIQLHWQYDHGQIAEGVARSSCILQENSWSQLNRLVAERIRGLDVLALLNLVEVDNICDYGQDIAVAMREHALRRAAPAGLASKADAGIGRVWTSPCWSCVGAAASLVGSVLLAALVTVRVALRCARAPRVVWASCLAPACPREQAGKAGSQGGVPDPPERCVPSEQEQGRLLEGAPPDAGASLGLHGLSPR
ncbi:unnamed protein product [Prorocentrum cordatum]|uniref:Phosphatidylinositol-specific phospholipase C X domain-containing protein n=1 Tax=Prorocentrum cordatum TaxID=2364126 RepID=A0ABN9W5F5_9DINO|nr:unnamed protein product [Polarella glacialis]